MKRNKLKLIRFVKSLLVVVLAMTVLAVSYNLSVPGEDGATVYTLSKLGSRGEEVRKIQTKLRSLGYYKGSVDGIYGTDTRNAVKAFQKNCGITIDGIAGPKTLRYLGLGSASTSQSGKYSESDINLLAKLIAAEARGESYTGQVAVGAVVLNRVSHSSFPDTVAGVIYQRGAFSAVTDSNWSVSGTAESLKAARDCINGWDPSGGAIYYYNPKKTSNGFMLSRPVIKTIGKHVFCR